MKMVQNSCFYCETISQYDNVYLANTADVSGPPYHPMALTQLTRTSSWPLLSFCWFL
jgi:hypothetical protein